MSHSQESSPLAQRIPAVTPAFNPYLSYKLHVPAEVLIIHPDIQLKSMLQTVLTAEGHRITAFEDGLDALEWLADCLIDGNRLPDLVVADICAPGRKGIDILADLRYAGWATPFILFDSKNRRHLAQDARRIGGAYVFTFPFEPEDFLVAVSFLTRQPGSRGYAA
ncbi:MAG: response regulator transcription factor [Deltaproteobacteria bacterium]|nr:response regulator transcription factor [Deltaproteobacteria bacterium]